MFLCQAYTFVTLEHLKSRRKFMFVFSGPMLASRKYPALTECPFFNNPMVNTSQKNSCTPNLMHLLSFCVSLSVSASLSFSAEEIIPTTYSIYTTQGLVAFGSLSLILLPSSLKREYIHYNHIFCSF